LEEKLTSEIVHIIDSTIGNKPMEDEEVEK
jgi:hypothetical protein